MNNFLSVIFLIFFGIAIPNQAQTSVKESKRSVVRHEGFSDFNKGAFGCAGANLFVDANGIIRRISDNDLNGDGLFDIVLPNSHGYKERSQTFIYSRKEGVFTKTVLPHDSGWKPVVADVDGDGYPDVIIANGGNGVTSELTSYIYWGGPDGLTGERAEFATTGAFDAVCVDLTNNGQLDVIFTTAWEDPHNVGKPMYQKVFVQTAPRVFSDATREYAISGIATTALLCCDLNGDGLPELVLANYRKDYDGDCESFIYWGKKGGGFDTSVPLRLPTYYASQAIAGDLDGDGWPELIFTGGSKFYIYWNKKGVFTADNHTILDIQGMSNHFAGILPTALADVDGDGMPELVIGTSEGVEIRKRDMLTQVLQKLPCYGISGLALYDVTGTGLPDIITTNYSTPKTYDTQSFVFWNSGTGYSTNNYSTFETHGPNGCAAVDLDRDGIAEIIFCNTMEGPAQMDPDFPVFAYFGTPDYRYSQENRRDYPVVMGAHTYASADLDNDGYVELVVTSFEGLRIFKGTKNGPDRGNYYDLIHTPDERRLIGGVLVGDFDRDGWLDLIMVPWGSNDASGSNNISNSVYIYRGGPNGYSDERRIPMPSNPSTSQSILLSDIDSDGYLDFIYGDVNGYIYIHYGGPDGLPGGRTGKLDLPEYNGAIIMGLATADIDGDGRLELLVTTAGHYTRKKSHLYIFRDGKNGFPPSAVTVFETGGTTGFLSLADMRKSGKLDLLLPFYSTHETRELPARIFYSDDKGDFDWDNPTSIDCLASIAFMATDLTGNGYPDVFVCCHRNNIGHIVDSRLYMNGPDGLDLEHPQLFEGWGPHNFTAQNQGNALDRSDNEYYISPVFAAHLPKTLSWEAETPHKTSLSFRVRFGKTEAETLAAPWSEPVTQSGARLKAPRDTHFMQYEVCMKAPAFVNSPKLRAVEIGSK